MVSQAQKLKWLVAGVVSCLLYYFVAYELRRTDTISLQISFAGLFTCFFFLVKTDLKWLLGFSILFRLIFLFSIPALSDDFYRFIWDGLLWHEGIHPFSHAPSWFMQKGNEVAALTPELFDNLNSKEYYTVYPPLHQLVFWLSTFSYEGNVLQAIVPMRLVVVVVDLLFVFFLTKIKGSGSYPSGFVSLYALNPLVIAETTGNLHFEGMMTFFLIAAIYHLSNRKIGNGSLSLAAAIATKLTPVIAGPALMLAAGRKNWWKIALITSLSCLLFFLPLFAPAWWGGQGQSLGLYFQKFEFNASLYYVIREIGFWLKGYNIIATLGPLLAILGGLLILVVSWSKRIKLPSAYHAVAVVFLVFYVFATTVHPWYIVPLVGLSVFTGYKFPIVWSYAILWTYAGYITSGYEVPWWMIIFEYTLVLGVFFVEVLLPFRKNKRIKTSAQ